MSLLSLFALALAAPDLSQTGPVSISSRYTKLDHCTEIAHGDVEQGEDWVQHKCQGYGGVPVWLQFMDSNKGFIGFGRRTNVIGWFGISRDNRLPIEWRGRISAGKFEPFAIIIRMPQLIDEPTRLEVFRLRPDGTSCIIGETASNIDARAIADASLTRFHCTAEPELQ
jgi:hypothetical protein